MTCFEFWSLTISAISALGTIGAVVVALQLARNQNAINIRAMAYKGMQFMGDGTPGQTCLIFKVINQFFRPINIKMIGWVFELKNEKPMHFAQNFSATNMNLGKNVPFNINVGEDEILMFEWDKFISGFKKRFLNKHDLDKIKKK